MLDQGIQGTQSIDSIGEKKADDLFPLNFMALTLRLFSMYHVLDLSLLNSGSLKRLFSVQNFKESWVSAVKIIPISPILVSLDTIAWYQNIGNQTRLSQFSNGISLSTLTTVAQ
jgi:hypothetical protein